MSAENFLFAEKRIHVVKVPRVSYQKRGNYSVVGPDGIRRPANRQMASGVSRPFGFISPKDNPQALITGLEEYLDNPYYKQTLDDIPIRFRPKGEWEGRWEQIKALERITRQMLYEIIDNVPEGYYISRKNMPTMGTPAANAKKMEGVEPTALEVFKIHLNEGTNVFENSSFRGRMGIQVALNHPKIANNRDVINENVHEFYIASEEEVLQESERKNTRYREAIVRLNEIIEDHDPQVTYQFAIITRAIQGNAPQREARKALNEFVIETKRLRGSNHEDRINTFNRVFVKFKEDPRYILAEYMVQQAYINHLFKDNAGNIYWVTKKGYPNLYELGMNRQRVINAFYEAMKTYDPDLDKDTNMYALLSEELAALGVAS